MNGSTSNLTRLSPYILRVSYTQWQTAYTLGEWAARNGFKKVYIAVSDYAAGIDSEKAFEKAFVGEGREIIGRVHMPQSTPDYVPYMQSVKDAKPDALFMFTNSGRVTTAAVKGFAEAGLRQAGITLLGPGDIASDEELANMGDAAIGTTTAAVYSAISCERRTIGVYADRVECRGKIHLRAQELVGEGCSENDDTVVVRQGNALHRFIS